MNFLPVRGSSNIESYGYDLKSGILAVRFHSGREYHYPGVPESGWKAFQAATSKGEHFERRVKPTYTGTRVK